MSELADLLERYRRGAELLAVATTGAAGPILDFKTAPDKWSVRQIVCHLADSEAIAVMRFRAILAEDNPTMVAWDQKAWAEKLGYQNRKISQALEQFRMLRMANYELLKDQPEEALARSGTHTVRGPMTARQLLELFAHHVENHVRQIQDVRAAFREQKAKQSAQQ